MKTSVIPALFFLISAPLYAQVNSDYKEVQKQEIRTITSLTNDPVTLFFDTSGVLLSCEHQKNDSILKSWMFNRNGQLLQECEEIRRSNTTDTTWSIRYQYDEGKLIHFGSFENSRVFSGEFKQIYSGEMHQYWSGDTSIQVLKMFEYEYVPASDYKWSGTIHTRINELEQKRTAYFIDERTEFITVTMEKSGLPDPDPDYYLLVYDRNKMPVRLVGLNSADSKDIRFRYRILEERNRDFVCQIIRRGFRKYEYKIPRFPIMSLGGYTDYSDCENCRDWRFPMEELNNQPQNYKVEYYPKNKDN